MQISRFAPLSSPSHGPDYIAALGRGAEERGFHGIWLGEHVVLFDDYASDYPYAQDGRIPFDGETHTRDRPRCSVPEPANRKECRTRRQLRVPCCL